MADKNPTTGDLFKAKAITSDEVDAAVDAVLALPDTGPYPIGGGYLLDLAEAVRSNEWAAVTVGTKDATEHLKRVAVRTAILLARPENA